MSEIWEAVHSNFISLMLIFIRVSGIFSFNPIMSRRGVPAWARVGTSLMLAVVMSAAYGNMGYVYPEGGMLPFAFDMAKELLVGVVLGFYVNLLLSLFSLAGEVSEMQIGLSMAKSYDPTFGQSGIISNYYSYWFMAYFFAVGGHLSYIKLFAYSFEVLPLGFTTVNINVAYILVSYFETVLTLGLKLAMPVVAASLITEFCIGVMMKAVPSIHVFVLNIQLKLLVGMVVLAASCGIISEFMDKLMGYMFASLNGLLGQMAA